MSARPSYRVWDPLVRVLHWTLAASVLLAWMTRHGAADRHEWIGYASLIAVAVRVAWGWAGSRYARFGQFIRSPAATLRYSRRVLAGSAPRHLGHNPLGGWMILALLMTTAMAGLSGWLYTTDAYWGEKWLEDVHEALSVSLLVLIAMHVAGVVVTSFAHRENLASAMIHGRKRAAEEGDVA